jgi:hypothetical protein
MRVAYSLSKKNNSNPFTTQFVVRFTTKGVSHSIAFSTSPQQEAMLHMYAYGGEIATERMVPCLEERSMTTWNIRAYSN